MDLTSKYLATLKGSEPKPADGSQEPERERMHQFLGSMLINVSNAHFKNRTVFVDGYRFINCIFERCKLMAFRGTFEFHSCVLKDLTERYFDDEAIKCIQLYYHSSTFSPKNAAFAAKTNADGSFSIASGVSCN